MASHAFTFPYRSGAFSASGGVIATVNSYAYGSQVTTSSSAIATVPPSNGFPVSIAGHNYMIDTSFEPYRREAFRHKSLQAQRQSLHFTNIPDDGTVSTEGLWRREQRDWSFGSGQIYFDRKDSKDNRFAHSKGVNPWIQWQLSLLNDVTNQHTGTGSVKAIAVGNYVYIADGNKLTYQTSWSGTATTVQNVSPILDVCTNGYDVFWVTKYGVFQAVAGSTSVTTIVASSNTSGVNTSGGTSYPWTASNSAFPLSAKLGYVGDRLIFILNNVAQWSSNVSSNSVGCNVFDLSYHITTATNLVGTVSGTTYTFEGQCNFVVGQSVDIFSPTWALPGAVNNKVTAVVTSVNVDTSAGNATPQFTVAISGTAPSGTGYGISATATNGTALPYSQGNEWIYTHPNPNWVMTSLSAGNAMVYFAGHPIDTSGSAPVSTGPGVVYRTGITSTSATNNPTAQYLSYPVQALPMPIGEYPTSLYCYLNYIFVGSNKGIRMCETINAYDPTGNAGDLKAGPLLPDITEIPNQPVTSIVGNDRYIYWAWNNYDSTSSGLGRLDLTTFLDNLAPAYASDLMLNGQGATGACTWLDWDPITNSPLMSMNNILLAGNVSNGNYIFTANPNSTVPFGTVDSGLITYGIPDNKNVMRLDFNVNNVVNSEANSSVSFQLYTDNNPGLQIESYSNTIQKASRDFVQQFGEQYRLVTTLAGSYDGTNYQSPTLNRWTLKGLPGIPSGIMISAVLNFYEPYEVEGSVVWSDPYVEYAFLESIRQSQQVVTYVEGPYTAQITIDMLDWLPERRRDVQIGGYHGDIVVYMKTLAG